MVKVVLRRATCLIFMDGSPAFELIPIKFWAIKKQRHGIQHIASKNSIFKIGQKKLATKIFAEENHFQAHSLSGSEAPIEARKFIDLVADYI